jgi:predicted membrane-bound mannosyltransferase
VPAHRRVGGWTLLLAAVFTAGIALRWWQLDLQVLIDDEWHALHKLLRSDWKGVFTRFGYADHSIPLTLYYKWVYETVGLSERRMHAPALLAGIALLGIVPWFARAWATWPTRVLWVALLALSPLLIYHSRTARPYALTSVLTFVAIVAYWRWRNEDRHRLAMAIA